MAVAGAAGARAGLAAVARAALAAALRVDHVLGRGADPERVRVCGAQVEPQHEAAEEGEAGSKRHERREELEDREVARDRDLVFLGSSKGWGG